MTEYVSNKTGKVYNDVLPDMDGICLFDINRNSISSRFPHLRKYTKSEWHTLGEIFNGYGKHKNSNRTIYVRFVHPNNPRFGSIARLHYSRGYYYNRYNDESDIMREWNNTSYFNGKLSWTGRSADPDFYGYSEEVEWLPDYGGPTVWAWDRNRGNIVERVSAQDKLGRPLAVGDFCTYILYQFDSSTAATICFGNVTKIDPDGSVWCRNVAIGGNSSKEKKVKDNSLITILTDDLMQQLMLAKLSSGT